MPPVVKCINLHSSQQFGNEHWSFPWFNSGIIANLYETLSRSLSHLLLKSNKRAHIWLFPLIHMPFNYAHIQKPSSHNLWHLLPCLSQWSCWWSFLCPPGCFHYQITAPSDNVFRMWHLKVKCQRALDNWLHPYDIAIVINHPCLISTLTYGFHE